MKNYFLLVLFIAIGFSAFAQEFELSGKVQDAEGNPLSGATVVLKETANGSIADADGGFKITKVGKGTFTLMVSFVGFETQSRSIHVEKSVSGLNFELKAQSIVLEGLVVTAQKREQTIVEIPTSLTSLGGNFLQETGATELDDLSEFVPGMQVQVQSPNNPGFVIRGITSDNGASNVEPRVSVFQDGVSISKSRGSVVEVFDMERVEVLKGPQGTLFGRGAQIGALHFIQNKAKNKTEGFLKAGYGDYNDMHFEGMFNTALVKDKLFARVAAIYKKHDGYINNLSGGTLNGKDTRAFRVSLRFKPTKMTNIDLIYNYQNDMPPGTSFKSGTYAPAGGDTQPWTTANLEAGEDLGLDRTVWGTTLIAKHYFNNNFSLTSTTAFREFDSYETFDSDGTAAPALLFAEDAYGKQFSEEIRANFKVSDRLQGFAGASFFYEDGYSHVPMTTNEQSLAVLYSGLLAPTVNTAMLTPINQAFSAVLGTPVNMTMSVFPLIDTNGQPVTINSLSELISTDAAYLPMLNNNPYDATGEMQMLYNILMAPLAEERHEGYTNYGTNKAYEFFADATYNISKAVNVTAGVRYTLEQIESGYSAYADPSGAIGVLGFARNTMPNDLFAPTEKITAEETYSSFVGRLAIDVKASESMGIYGNVSRGRRPNVIQFRTVADASTLTSTYEMEELNDEIVMSYEIGTKGLLANNSLYYDIAAFYYDYTDFQTSAVDENLQVITKDAGNASALGFEASLKWQLNRTFNVFGNYSYVKAEFDDEDSDGNAQEYAGNTFRLTPEHSFALGCNVNWAVAKNLHVFFRPTYSYKTDVYFEEDNLETEMQEGFGLLNLRAGVQLPAQRITVQAFVNNATNEDYIIDAGNTGRNFGIPTYISGAPRVFGFELSYKF